jgi:hypothetical protein
MILTEEKSNIHFVQKAESNSQRTMYESCSGDVFQIFRASGNANAGLSCDAGSAVNLAAAADSTVEAPPASWPRFASTFLSSLPSPASSSFFRKSLSCDVGGRRNLATSINSGRGTGRSLAWHADMFNFKLKLKFKFNDVDIPVVAFRNSCNGAWQWLDLPMKGSMSW